MGWVKYGICVSVIQCVCTVYVEVCSLLCTASTVCELCVNCVLCAQFMCVCDSEYVQRVCALCVCAVYLCPCASMAAVCVHRV